MRNARISFCLLALILAVFAPASLPRAFADADADKAAATDMLLSGQWRFTTKTWSEVRVFAKDGTFKTLNKTDKNGQWTMTKDFVILIYPNGHKDALYLPLVAKGTEGLADNGDTMTAVLENAAPIAGATPAIESMPGSEFTPVAPVAAAPTPAPTPASGFMPVAPVAAAPTPAPALKPPAVRIDRVATAALLVSKPWRITGDWWFAIRVFAKDGTFTTVANLKERGTWAITDNAIALTFGDGHQDLLALPLNPMGTDGLDKDGKHMTAMLGRALPEPEATPDSHIVQNDMDTFFHPAPAPHVMTAQEQAAIVNLLTSAPWKFIGPKWTAHRVFAKDGTFTTSDHETEYGVWKISGDKIIITFADGHSDTMSLPLDPKGTDCGDKAGTPVNAILQDAATLAAPTPVPISVPAPVRPTYTPGPVPQGPTPPPFGTQQPPG